MPPHWPVLGHVERALYTLSPAQTKGYSYSIVIILWLFSIIYYVLKLCSSFSPSLVSWVSWTYAQILSLLWIFVWLSLSPLFFVSLSLSLSSCLALSGLCNALCLELASAPHSHATVGVVLCCSHVLSRSPLTHRHASTHCTLSG